MLRAHLLFSQDNAGGLAVHIETERLFLNSLTPTFLSNYQKLFGDPENVALYKYGQPWAPAETRRWMDTWLARWRQQIPFSALAVFRKDMTAFIGHIECSETEQAGQCQIRYIFDKSCWGNGYGKEAVTAVVKRYLPELAKRGYTLGAGRHALASLQAIARPENIGSIKILKAAGLEQAGRTEQYGGERYLFLTTLKVPSNSSC